MFGQVPWAPIPARPPLVQAYCLYRLGKLQAALAALGEVPVDKEVARLQLEAQVGGLQGGRQQAGLPAMRWGVPGGSTAHMSGQR